MTSIFWLTQTSADVPSSDDALGRLTSPDSEVIEAVAGDIA